MVWTVVPQLLVSISNREAQIVFAYVVRHDTGFEVHQRNGDLVRVSKAVIIGRAPSPY